MSDARPPKAGSRWKADERGVVYEVAPKAREGRVRLRLVHDGEAIGKGFEVTLAMFHSAYFPAEDEE